MKRRLAGLTGARDGHDDNSPTTFTRSLADDAELVVREKTLQNDGPPFELVPVHVVAGRPARGSPDDRHRLDVLCADGREKLLDRVARRWRTCHLPGGAGRGRRGARDRRDGKQRQERCQSEWSLHPAKP